MIKVIQLEEDHVKTLINGNLSPNVKIEDLMQAYQSKGSLAYTLMIDDKPIVCGGIVNMNWRRGEAWLLSSSEFLKHKKTSWRILKQLFPYLAKQGGFRRIQSTSKIESSFLEHLGFKYEAKLEAFDPDGNDVFLYKRIFK